MRFGNFSEEDPTFRVRSDENTGQTIISGMGELHLDVLVDRMLREFKVKANVGRPGCLTAKPLPTTSTQIALQICQTNRWSWSIWSCGISILNPLDRWSGYSI